MCRTTTRMFFPGINRSRPTGTGERHLVVHAGGPDGADRPVRQERPDQLLPSLGTTRFGYAYNGWLIAGTVALATVQRPSGQCWCLSMTRSATGPPTSVAGLAGVGQNFSDPPGSGPAAPALRRPPRPVRPATTAATTSSRARPRQVAAAADAVHNGVDKRTRRQLEPVMHLPRVPNSAQLWPASTC